MVFSDPIFVFLFIPIFLVFFYASTRLKNPLLTKVVIVLFSLAFYGWWKVEYLSIILISVAFNYIVHIAILRSAGARKRKLFFVTLGIIGNLLALGYYKYYNFFIESLDFMFGFDIQTFSIILPLAISFFTFQQIAFLCDTYSNKTGRGHFIDYIIFVCFFPQLIAGPIVHHSNMMPQFANNFRDWSNYSFQNIKKYLIVGMALFCIGLFKKVIIADNLSQVAGPVFDAYAAGGVLSTTETWLGVLAYTSQIYFDFSGYSDMAAALAFMVGIRLPRNFFSPYKAGSIVDFWRRWHITLSNFLRDYLYIPLGGNRGGSARRYLNLMITMLLGGLWHGASVVFIAWGALHGGALVVCHLWTRYAPGSVRRLLDHGGGWLITMLVVITGWVLFRAADLDTATSILHSMIAGADAWGLQTSGDWPPLAVQLLVLSGVIALWFPNTVETFHNQDVFLADDRTQPPSPTAADRSGVFGLTIHIPPFELNVRWAIVIGSLAFFYIVYVSRIGAHNEFIYFQF
ncbi:MBOAT family O-acyltransferase [Maricaulis salignorans]|uniref:MBOAT family O-acyltransferase n=1 Tax=Maricaulis salignorans TaxID=144026 RepID=UPI003A8F3C18